jgi:hypothetical protein
MPWVSSTLMEEGTTGAARGAGATTAAGEIGIGGGAAGGGVLNAGADAGRGSFAI